MLQMYVNILMNFSAGCDFSIGVSFIVLISLFSDDVLLYIKITYNQFFKIQAIQGQVTEGLSILKCLSSF